MTWSVKSRSMSLLSQSRHSKWFNSPFCMIESMCKLMRNIIDTQIFVSSIAKWLVVVLQASFNSHHLKYRIENQTIRWKAIQGWNKHNMTQQNRTTTISTSQQPSSALNIIFYITSHHTNRHFPTLFNIFVTTPRQFRVIPSLTTFTLRLIVLVLVRCKTTWYFCE